MGVRVGDHVRLGSTGHIVHVVHRVWMYSYEVMCVLDFWAQCAVQAVDEPLTCFECITQEAHALSRP